MLTHPSTGSWSGRASTDRASQLRRAHARSVRAARGRASASSTALWSRQLKSDGTRKRDVPTRETGGAEGPRNKVTTTLATFFSLGV